MTTREIFHELRERLVFAEDRALVSELERRFDKVVADVETWMQRSQERAS